MLLSPPPTTISDYLTETLNSSDIWARKEAIDALGQIKPRPVELAKHLNPHLNSDHLETKIAAAKTRFLLTDDKKQFDSFLIELIDKNNPDNQDDWNARRKCFSVVRAIGELQIHGRPFLEHIKTVRKRYESEFSDDICTALKKIGGKKAIEVLHELSRSRDWKVKTKANDAIADINQKRN